MSSTQSDAGSVAPTQEVLSTEFRHEKGGKHFYLKMATVVLMLIAAIVIPTSVVVSQKKAESKQISGGDDGWGSGGNTGEDGNTAEDGGKHLESVVEYLVQNGVSSKDDLTNEVTPQYQAAKWIAEIDTYFSTLPPTDVTQLDGYRFMSRYIMALNYFALGGNDWYEKMDFLATDVDVCFWNNGVDGMKGVYCDIYDDPVPRWVLFSKFGFGWLVCFAVVR